MYLPESLLALLLLQLTRPATAEPQPAWPHNLPGHLKYFPENEAHMKRSLSVQERLERGERPIGVRKMSEDEGEMFFLDHWIFAGDTERDIHPEPQQQQNGNLSISEFSSPLRPLADINSPDFFGRFIARSGLALHLKRDDFKCPAGTSDCSSIGAPNSCCGSGSTCISIKDTGLGSVACCASGTTCEGTISCNEAAGYSSCPGSENGGCCLPGYACRDVGCKCFRIAFPTSSFLPC